MIGTGFYISAMFPVRNVFFPAVVSGQIMEQNSFSDLYLDELSVWRIIRLDRSLVSSMNSSNVDRSCGKQCSGSKVSLAMSILQWI